MAKKRRPPLRVSYVFVSGGDTKLEQALKLLNDRLTDELLQSEEALGQFSNAIIESKK